MSLQKDQQFHLAYGWVKLKKGKMSSRLGNVVLGEWLIDEAKKEIYRILEKSTVKPSGDRHSGKPEGRIQNPDSGVVASLLPRMTKYSNNEEEEIAEKAAIAAVKYSFLKVGTKQEIAFDLSESVSFEGDSGPYLQYTYARAKSVLRKAGQINLSFRTPVGKLGEKSSPAEPDVLLRFARSLVSLEMTNKRQFNIEELLVLRLIYRYPEIVATAAEKYAPNVLCEYLYDLASAFNTFYNKHTILGVAKHEVKSQSIRQAQDEKSKVKNEGTVSQFRILLTSATAQVLKNGLHLLGIETLEKM